MKMKRSGLPVGFAKMVIAMMLGGCTLTPPSQQLSARYDLGPLPRYEHASPQLSATLMLPEVTAPSWLDGRGIVYRLAYDEPARLQTYSRSQWKAPPQALLSQRLRARFSAAARNGIVTGDDGARAGYALRVDLEDFSQTFSAPGASGVTVRARASLINSAQRALAAQRVFSVERPAPSPDARGAVTALARASDELIEELLGWTSEQLRHAPAPGQKK